MMIRPIVVVVPIGPASRPCGMPASEADIHVLGNEGADYRPARTEVKPIRTILLIIIDYFAAARVETGGIAASNGLSGSPDTPESCDRLNRPFTA